MFAVEDLMRERLQGIPGIKKVGSARDLDEVFEGQITPPAIYIVFQRGEVDKEEQCGPCRMMEQIWVVALATRDFSKPEEGDRQSADVLLESINQRLMGKTLGVGYEPIELIDIPQPSFLENINLYAMRYLVRFPIKGAEERN